MAAEGVVELVLFVRLGEVGEGDELVVAEAGEGERGVLDEEDEAEQEADVAEEDEGELEQFALGVEAADEQTGWRRRRR